MIREGHAGIEQRPARDRGQTETRIRAAAKALLAEVGFKGFGINAVARRAGCDKQLIYRYFGGLAGLIDTMGEDLGCWMREHIPEDSGGMFLLTYGDLVERLALLFLDALRADPLIRRIAAWELAEESSLCAASPRPVRGRSQPG